MKKILETNKEDIIVEKSEHTLTELSRETLKKEDEVNNNSNNNNNNNNNNEKMKNLNIKE